jgi:LDH2 family malate/lactate/ureidoglycolate dehydrogenase
VVARNLNHFGAAAYYSMMAAARGMIGMTMTNVLALMAPTGGTERVVGNNPLSFAFPSAGEDPIVWDSAMSRSTWGALLLAQQRDEPLAEGAFLAADGQPTRDPAAVLAGGSLVPIAGYKGYGLALAIALLTGVLAGWRFDAELGGGLSSSSPGDNTALMAAIRVSDFIDPGEFAGRVEAIAEMIHAVPTQSGVDRIWLPGEKEAEARKQRLMAGVPVGPAVRADIEGLANRLGVDIEGLFRTATA